MHAAHYLQPTCKSALFTQQANYQAHLCWCGYERPSPSLACPGSRGRDCYRRSALCIASTITYGKRIVASFLFFERSCLDPSRFTAVCSFKHVQHKVDSRQDKLATHTHVQTHSQIHTCTHRTNKMDSYHAPSSYPSLPLS